MRLLLMTAFALVTVVSAQQQPAQPQSAPPEISAVELLVRASRWTMRFDQNLSGLLFREKYFQRTEGHQNSDMTTDGGAARPMEVRGSNGRLLESNIVVL